MAPTPVRFVPESPGIAPQTVTQESQRRPISRYAGRGRSSRSLRGLETRGTASCCIRSKSSRFFVHPFREGNGRTQRVFWNRVAADAGWQLDWRPVQGAVNDAACRAAAESRDFGPMRAMFDQVVSPAGTVADPTSALDRFALRTSRSIDQAMDAARLAGMDHPAAPVAKPPTGPRAPEAFGATAYRPGRDQGPDLGR